MRGIKTVCHNLLHLGGASYRRLVSLPSPLHWDAVLFGNLFGEDL